jgi:S1-C subfamily serine protease
VIAAATLASAEWFDPTATGGRVERKAAAGKALGKGAFPLALRFAEGPVAAGGEGSAIVDEHGACVAVVARVREGPAPACVVRPLDLARGLLAGVAADARYDPPDLGVRFEPAPAEDGAPALPPDLERLRATTREKGGAVVGPVSARSPALGALWPGDLVLEIEGLPVFGDVPETVVLALEALRLDTPVEVVTWRGGRRESVTVRAVPGRSVHPDFQAEHDARGGPRSPR